MPFGKRGFSLFDHSHSKWQEAHDSRVFGPIQMTDIVGRVIYSMRTAVDHGPVVNRWATFLSLISYIQIGGGSFWWFIYFTRLPVITASFTIHQCWKWNWMLMRWQNVLKPEPFFRQALIWFLLSGETVILERDWTLVHLCNPID